MEQFRKLFKLFKENNAGDIIQLVISRIVRQRIKNYAYIRTLFSDKSGIEIGGPSGDFKNHGFIPLYKIIKKLDGCNFSTTTIWEGNIENGKQYKYYRQKTGTLFISEATDMSFSDGLTYDFAMSSNCLEHVANPLKAVQEWIRVIKKDGLLLLLLPNKDDCFDRNRPITEFSHLLDDFQKNIKEDDLTHLEEILELHDLKMDKSSGTIEQFRERSLKNYENRALHHHVFNISVLKEIFDYFKLEVLFTYQGRRGHVILGRKKFS